MTARRALVTLTDAARAQIGEIARASGKPTAGVRLSLKKGGCAGMEYDMTLVEAADARDEAVPCGDTTLFIAASAAMFLVGSEIDYRTGLLESGFVFDNPNVTDACGCGESVRFAPMDETSGAAPTLS